MPPASLRVNLNPNCVVSQSGDRAIDLLAGLLIEVPPKHHQRLRYLQEQGDAELEREDFDLLDLGLLRVADDAENQLRIVRDRVMQTLGETGSLCIMPTEKCNFRCTYCYETFAKGRMPPNLVKAVIQFLAHETPKFKAYSLGWFGGEPLLQTDVIMEVVKAYRQLQAQYGFLGSVGITTNGYLLDGETRRSLARLPVDLYHISVDGPASVHNSQRVMPSGADTYERILSNIKGLLADTAAHVIFRVNVDTSIEGRAAEVAGWLRSQIVPLFSDYSDRLRYHIVSVWDATTTSVEGICVSDAARFQRRFTIEKAVAEATGEDVAARLAAHAAPLGAMACYAGKPHQYVLGSDGQVYKCTVALDLPENKIGQLLPDGTLDIDPALEALWTSSNVLTDPVCGSCAFGGSCMGLHCPLTRLQTGTQPCPTEKRFVRTYLNPPTRRPRTAIPLGVRPC